MDFAEQRALALAILNKGERLTKRAGSLLGQLAVDDSPLTPKQADWFCQLAHRAGYEIEGGSDAR